MSPRNVNGIYLLSGSCKSIHIACSFKALISSTRKYVMDSVSRWKYSQIVIRGIFYTFLCEENIYLAEKYYKFKF